mmetsp:Transcript_81054/g.160630  ORF Transcript_81054/g.160630 Transcript_81054/m.160630 type:complete len:516 (-) Transcript_81054:671-2218(-)
MQTEPTSHLPAKSFWKVVQQEVTGTFQEFRQKGAVNVFRDAALDAADLAKDASDLLTQGIKTAVSGDGLEKLEDEIFIAGPAVPEPGDSVTLQFTDGTCLTEAQVLAVDSLSEQPRARVMIEGAEKPLLVPIWGPDVAQQMLTDASENMSTGNVELQFDAKADIDARADTLSLVKQEWSERVQGIREMCDIQAIKEAAFDTVDAVHGKALSAVDVAKSVATPCLDEIREKGTVAVVKDATGAVKEATVGVVTQATVSVVDRARSTAIYGTASEQATDLLDKAKSTAIYGAASEHATDLLSTIKHEWEGTVHDFKEKGAVGTMKDAALDARDIVVSTASSAINVACDAAVGPKAQAVLEVVDQASTKASGTMQTAANIVHGARNSTSQLLTTAAKILEVPNDTKTLAKENENEVAAKSATQKAGSPWNNFRSKLGKDDIGQAEPGPEPRITPRPSERVLKVTERIKQLTAQNADANALPERNLRRRNLVKNRTKLFEKPGMADTATNKAGNDEFVD